MKLEQLTDAQKKTLLSMVMTDYYDDDTRRVRHGKRKSVGMITTEYDDWGDSILPDRVIKFSAADFKYNAAADQIYK